MCGDLHGQRASGQDEFLLDTPLVRAFIAGTRAAVREAAGPTAAIAAIRPAFARLLGDATWLPAAYQAPVPESGMGGGIGQWLLFRSGDGDLSLFALVVPPGAATPVHDHLAWGADRPLSRRAGGDGLRAARRCRAGRRARRIAAERAPDRAPGGFLPAPAACRGYPPRPHHLP